MSDTAVPHVMLTADEQEAIEVRITREDAHCRIDEMFNELETIGKNLGYELTMQRLMLMADTDGSISGVVLVRRPVSHGPFVTWGLSPFGAGLHSGHYDMPAGLAYEDWVVRARRGW